MEKQDQDDGGIRNLDDYMELRQKQIELKQRQERLKKSLEQTQELDFFKRK